MVNDQATAVELKTADGVPIRAGMLVYVPAVAQRIYAYPMFCRAIVAVDPEDPERVPFRRDISNTWITVVTRQSGAGLGMEHWGTQHVHSSSSSFMRQAIEAIQEQLRRNQREIEALVIAEEAARAAAGNEKLCPTERIATQG